MSAWTTCLCMLQQFHDLEIVHSRSLPYKAWINVGRESGCARSHCRRNTHGVACTPPTMEYWSYHTSFHACESCLSKRAESSCQILKMDSRMQRSCRA